MTLARFTIALLAGLGLSQAALAHAKLVSADPPIGGTAGTPPRKLDLTFSEAISAKLSGASVKPAGGGALPAMAGLGQAGKTLSLMLKAPLKPGVYAVEWHAVASDDGHRTEGTYRFTVR